MTPRVLIVTPSAYVLGGLATWLDYLEPGLRQRGWDVTVGLVEGPTHHRPERYLAEHPHQQWITIPCRTGTPEGRCRAMVRAFRQVRPALVATVNIPDAIRAVASLRSCGKVAPKVVMTVHGVQPDLYGDLRTYRSVLDGAVCTNRLAERLSVECGGMPAQRVTYAPYGVRLPVPVEEGRDSGRLVIGWVGRLEQDQKRIHDVARILTALRRRGVPFRCLIAGSGPEKEAVRRELAATESQGEVCLLGRLDARAVAERVYRQADVFLLTSDWETGPIVVWEAMSHGLAVVSSEYTGSRLEGALKHGHNALLFPIGDVDLAASHLERLWKDRELARRLGHQGRVTVEARYTMDRSVDAWDTALRSLLRDTETRQCRWAEAAAPRGRLDRWLGPEIAERVRGVLGGRFTPACPGSEWPHAHSPTAYDDEAFWALARALESDEEVSCRG